MAICAFPTPLLGWMGSLVKEEANVICKLGLMLKKVLNKKSEEGSQKLVKIFPKINLLTEGLEGSKLFKNVLQTDEAVHPQYQTEKLGDGWVPPTLYYGTIPTLRFCITSLITHML